MIACAGAELVAQRGRHRPPRHSLLCPFVALVFAIIRRRWPHHPTSRIIEIFGKLTASSASTVSTASRGRANVLRVVERRLLATSPTTRRHQDGRTRGEQIAPASAQDSASGSSFNQRRKLASAGPERVALGAGRAGRRALGDRRHRRPPWCPVVPREWRELQNQMDMVMLILMELATAESAREKRYRDLCLLLRLLIHGIDTKSVTKRSCVTFPRRGDGSDGQHAACVVLYTVALSALCARTAARRHAPRPQLGPAFHVSMRPMHCKSIFPMG